MNASKVGDIGIRGMGLRMEWPKTRFVAVREKGSDYLEITVPAGPKTEKTLNFRIREAELRELVEWMKD